WPPTASRAATGSADGAPRTQLMKLTWFGGRTLRIHMGGRIVVWRPAPIAGVAEEELVSGADRVVTGGAGLARLDGTNWRPRRTASALDETERLAEMQVAEFGEDVGLIEIPGEPPLLVAGAPSPRLGRWARDAVVVAFSSIAAASMLEAAGP